LVYQTGVVTHAHHYHPTAGGIYFFVTCRPPFTNWLIERTGWIAEVEPIGKISTQCISGDTCGRAEGVRTTRIVAYCMHRATSTGGPATHPSGLIALEQGILLSRPPNNSKWRRLSSDTKPGDLLPLCNSHELQPMEDAPFSFRVQDGTVFYSRPAVP
jgi:hypothetical protein